MLLRYPQLIPAGSMMDELVLNIDLAPTLLDLAGAAIPKDMQGKSLLPLLQGGKPLWRQSFLLEYFNDPTCPRVQDMGYQAVRGANWKYIHYTGLDNLDELYDLQWDPYEMKNLYSDPAAQTPLLKIQLEMIRLVQETN